MQRGRGFYKSSNRCIPTKIEIDYITPKTCPIHYQGKMQVKNSCWSSKRLYNFWHHNAHSTFTIQPSSYPSSCGILTYYLNIAKATSCGAKIEQVKFKISLSVLSDLDMWKEDSTCVIDIKLECWHAEVSFKD